MCNTRGAAAVAALRQRVWLFAPSVTVCVVVCMAHDLRVGCRLLRGAVAVLHIHARLGESRQHSC
jgi:hypothetical protein